MGGEDTPPPVYEVEFIPIERRINDRRKPGEPPPPGVERRNPGRRRTDRPPVDDAVPDKDTTKPG